MNTTQTANIKPGMTVIVRDDARTVTAVDRSEYSISALTFADGETLRFKNYSELVVVA